MSMNLTPRCSADIRRKPPRLVRDWQRSHKEQPVTVEPRRRYNMSHCLHLATLWHGRCLYINTRPPRGARDQRRKDRRRVTRKATHENFGQAHEAAHTVTGQQQEDTPPQQASDRPAPHPRGFFLPRPKKRQPRGAALMERPVVPGHWGTRRGVPGTGAPVESVGLVVCLPLAPSPQLLHQPHFESPQFKQVMQPSIMITAAVLHLAQSCAPSGKCVFAKASVCLARASYSARFSSTSLR
jgi:hypothetical protein